MKSLAYALVVAAAPLAAQAGEVVSYTVNGEAFEGYRAEAAGMSKGLVIVIHDWDGLTEYEVKRADMLAEMGYDAFAVDLYGKGNRPVETGAKKAETGKLYKNRERMRSLILGGLGEARKSNPGEAVVMGYCFRWCSVIGAGAFRTGEGHRWLRYLPRRSPDSRGSELPGETRRPC